MYWKTLKMLMYNYEIKSGTFFTRWCCSISIASIVFIHSLFTALYTCSALSENFHVLYVLAWCVLKITYDRLKSENYRRGKNPGKFPAEVIFVEGIPGIRSPITDWLRKRGGALHLSHDMLWRVSGQEERIRNDE